MPSLRLKKWNATRWLGRSNCLEALCNAYPYVLDHLQKEMNLSTNKADVRKVAKDLYRNLTSYDYLLFFFFYRDVTAIFVRTSKLLQAEDLQMSDIGRYISVLHQRLMTVYSKEEKYPPILSANGEVDNLMKELFGDQGTTSLLFDNFEFIFKRTL